RISRISSSVAPRMASAVFSLTELAPRSATSRMAGNSTKRAELFDLRRFELAVLALLERAQAQRPEGHPLERADRVPDRLEHPLDLALAALVDGQLEVVGAQPPDLRGRGDAVLELDALAQRADRGLVDGRV